MFKVQFENCNFFFKTLKFKHFIDEIMIDFYHVDILQTWRVAFAMLYMVRDTFLKN